VDNGTQGHNGRIRVPAVLAAGAVLLLALGAAASSSAHGSAARGSGPLAAQWWLLGLAALCASAAVFTWLRRRIVGADAPSSAEHRLQRGVLAMAAILVAALPVTLFLLHNRGDGSGGETCTSCPELRFTETPPQQTHPVSTVTAVPKPGHDTLPFGIILLVVASLIALFLIVGLVLLILTYLRNRGLPQEIGGAPLPASEGEQDDSALNKAVLAGREALEGEARAAIIACYAAMEDSLAAAGVPRLESDSPADLLARATERGALDGPAPGRLAALFREARYSTHPLDAEHLGRARTALDEIAAQLAARREAQERLARDEAGPGPAEPAGAARGRPA
jgi:hypothetical protein